jgi:hypothetical protein
MRREAIAPRIVLYVLLPFIKRVTGIPNKSIDLKRFMICFKDSFINVKKQAKFKTSYDKHINGKNSY